MTLQGIDVSNWQGQFDWAGPQTQGVQFALIKATEGTGFADPDFARNWSEAKTRGLVRGAYHFLHPDQPIEAQASWFLSHVHDQGLDPGDLLIVDYEVTGVLPPEAAADAAGHFVAIVNSATGASTVVYTNRALPQAGYCAGLGGSPLWLAAWGETDVTPPLPWHLLSFVQTGIRGVDQDTAFFDDQAQLRKLGIPATSHPAVGVDAAAVLAANPSAAPSAPAPSADSAAASAGSPAASAAPSSGAATTASLSPAAAAADAAGVVAEHVAGLRRIVTMAEDLAGAATILLGHFKP